MSNGVEDFDLGLFGGGGRGAGGGHRLEVGRGRGDGLDGDVGAVLDGFGEGGGREGGEGENGEAHFRECLFVASLRKVVSELKSRVSEESVCCLRKDGGELESRREREREGVLRSEVVVRGREGVRGVLK